MKIKLKLLAVEEMQNGLKIIKKINIINPIVAMDLYIIKLRRVISK